MIYIIQHTYLLYLQVLIYIFITFFIIHNSIIHLNFKNQLKLKIIFYNGYIVLYYE